MKDLLEEKLDKRLNEAIEIITALLDTFVYDIMEENLNVDQIDIKLKAERFLDKVK